MAIEQQTADDTVPLEGLTGFRRDILYTLARCEIIDGEPIAQPTGVEIKQALADAYGGRVNHGRFYQNIRELAERDLVEKGDRSARANYYMLTESTRAALWDRLEWEEAMLDGE